MTRQHPMTAKGTVFLALEDETGMVNVTLWPDTWARLRGVVRRHALLLVDGDLQREGEVVNVIAHEVRPLPEVAARGRRAGSAGGRPPARPCRDAPAGLRRDGVRKVPGLVAPDIAPELRVGPPRPSIFRRLPRQPFEPLTKPERASGRLRGGGV